ncbi:MAG: dihydroorotate dehydrogenase-like protein [Myxococcaceae bacterium]
MLSTSWLGLELEHPLMLGASPMGDELESVRRLEDAGCSAITMRSLFEEQLLAERRALDRHLGQADPDTFKHWAPTPDDFVMGPEHYLEKIRRVREAVSVPIIGSLNGATEGGWLKCAELIESAGASALELNLYTLPSDPDRDAASIEAEQVAIVKAVTARLKIPVGVKLSPFYSSLPHFAKRLEEAGAAGVVVFNRLYQPDLDPVTFTLSPMVQLSHPGEVQLRLRWLAILSAKTKLSLAMSGGVADGLAAVKALMAGASAVQLVSEVLRYGPERLTAIRHALNDWLDANGYATAKEIVGRMNHARISDPSGYERANYIKLLQGWKS